MSISDSHKSTKNAEYWRELTSGVTSRYKEHTLDLLLNEHMRTPFSTVADIGCGTSEMVLRITKRFQAKRVICLDYDKKIVEAMQEQDRGAGVEWLVGDIFTLNELDPQTQLVLFIDMLHEVYSFYGRPDGNLKTPIDHSLGLSFVVKALKRIGNMVCQGGSIAITDNVLCEEDHPVKVRLKHREMLRAIAFFFGNYPSRIFNYRLTGDVLEMNSRDFCVLLTQYNKIKNKEFSRWETEKFEVHQYMTVSEYKDCFNTIGFDCHAVVGTPGPTRDEWEEDIAILEGLDRFPEKRITLLAKKR